MPPLAFLLTQNVYPPLFWTYLLVLPVTNNNIAFYELTPKSYSANLSFHQLLSLCYNKTPFNFFLICCDAISTFFISSEFHTIYDTGGYTGIVLNISKLIGGEKSKSKNVAYLVRTLINDKCFLNQALIWCTQNNIKRNSKY